MALQSLSSNAVVSSEPPSDVRLRGWKLLFARALWIAFVVLVISIFVTRLRVHFDLITAIESGMPLPFVANYKQTLVFKYLNLSSVGYVQIAIALEVVYFLWFVGLAFIVVHRKFNEPLALFVSQAFLGIGAMGLFLAGGLRILEFQWVVISLFVEAVTFASWYCLFYLFPNGRFVPRWSWLCVLLFGITIPFHVYTQLLLMEVDWWRVPYLLRPLFMRHSFIQDFSWHFYLGWGWIGSTGGVLAQIYRYKYISTPIERQQTKWTVLGLVIPFLAIVLREIVIHGLVLREGASPALRTTFSMFRAAVFHAVPYILLSLTFAIAIRRYRLWDIDLIIRRTLVYSALTGLLLLAYVSSIVLFHSLFGILSSQASQPAIITSTLTVAALFHPLHRRIQDFIDRRFYRRKYNAEQMLAAFSTSIRRVDGADPEHLSRELARIIEESVQPSHVSIWLREDLDAAKAWSEGQVAKT